MRHLRLPKVSPLAVDWDYCQAVLPGATRCGTKLVFARYYRQVDGWGFRTGKCPRCGSKATTMTTLLTPKMLDRAHLLDALSPDLADAIVAAGGIV